MNRYCKHRSWPDSAHDEFTMTGDEFWHRIENGEIVDEDDALLHISGWAHAPQETHYDEMGISPREALAWIWKIVSNRQLAVEWCHFHQGGRQGSGGVCTCRLNTE